MERRYSPDLGPVKVITTTPTPGALTEPVPPVIGVKPTPVVRTSKHAAGRTPALDSSARAKATRKAQRQARKAGRK
jgi:hypothetical protein